MKNVQEDPEQKIKISVSLSIINDLYEIIKKLRKERDNFWGQIKNQMESNQLPIPRGIEINYSGMRLIVDHIRYQNKIQCILVKESGSHLDFDTTKKLIPLIAERLSKGIDL